jgi:hypothetical protein
MAIYLPATAHAQALLLLYAWWRFILGEHAQAEAPPRQAGDPNDITGIGSVFQLFESDDVAGAGTDDLGLGAGLGRAEHSCNFLPE